jgi:hypothetical protein
MKRLLFAFLLSSSAAMAAHHPCHEAVEKFCSGVKPGDGRVHACLNANKEKLGPKCTEKLDSYDEMKETAK